MAILEASCHRQGIIILHFILRHPASEAMCPGHSSRVWSDWLAGREVEEDREKVLIEKQMGIEPIFIAPLCN